MSLEQKTQMAAEATKAFQPIAGSTDETVLQEAMRLVESSGERREAYGTALDNFQCIADLWTAFKGVKFEPEDVGWMMILMKASRGAHMYKRDNVVDACGYARCIEMVIDQKAERDRKIE